MLPATASRTAVLPAAAWPSIHGCRQRRVCAEADDPDAPRIALVEVAPPRRGGGHLVGAGSPCLLGRLSPDREWFVTTPAILTLDDGRVLAATERARR